MSQQVPKVEFLTERAKLAAGRDQTVDVLIRITPPEIDAGIAKRPRLNLSLVLDRSGSMAGEKMLRAREATAYCIDQLLPADRLSVVIFDDVIEVLIPSQLAENKSQLKGLLAEVYARNSTALHEAWMRGGLQVSERLTEGAVNRVVLVTDGLANIGVTNVDEIVSQVKGLSERGVSTSTIGIGDDFNEDLLVPMARAGEGNSWHVKTADDMQRIFAIELEGLIAQVAHTVTLGLVPADGVRLSDVLNDFEMGETGRYLLPNLQAGSPIDVVVQLRVPAQAEGTKMRLLDLRLGYTPQEMRSAEVVKQVLEVEYVSEQVFGSLPVNHEIAKAVQMLMNARARAEAVRLMDSGDYVGSRNVIRDTILCSDLSFAPMATSPEVREEMDMLLEYESSLGDRSSDKMSRKRLMYDSVSRRRSQKLS
ncbi:MAG: Ca-activated chloride channel [Acidobacteriota bacterium]|jgi:Ca-activated chloride channel family protein|nr:Ca-activated chloride channel [Acidobacteriota bacterium]